MNVSLECLSTYLSKVNGALIGVINELESMMPGGRLRWEKGAMAHFVDELDFVVFVYRARTIDICDIDWRKGLYNFSI